MNQQAQQTLPSVRKTITVAASQQRAFQVYTEGMNSWWPREHHTGSADLAEAILEPRVGGRMYERGVDGSECEWGKVLAYEPPHRIVYSWQLQGDFHYDPDPAKGSEVEVRFTAEGPKTTRVEFEHRNFEAHGIGAEKVRNGVSSPKGWEYILELFVTTVAAD